MCCSSSSFINKINLEKLIMKFNQLLQIVIILIFISLALQERSFPVARPVKRVSDHVLTAKKEMAVGGDSDCFSLAKEIVPVERIARKMRGEARKKAMKGKGKKVVSNSVENRKGDEEEDSFMAFSSDYHPPKPHPPKNN